MSDPISVRLDDDVRAEIEAEAARRGVGVSALLREIARDAARESRRRRIRAESAKVAAYVASSPEASTFYEEIGTPHFDAV